jgi:hypothetical protein
MRSYMTAIVQYAQHGMLLAIHTKTLFCNAERLQRTMVIDQQWDCNVGKTCNGNG